MRNGGIPGKAKIRSLHRGKFPTSWVNPYTVGWRFASNIVLCREVGPTGLGVMGSESASEYGMAYWRPCFRGRPAGADQHIYYAILASMLPRQLGERGHAIDVDAVVHVSGRLLHLSGIAGGTNGCLTASDPCCIG